MITLFNFDEFPVLTTDRLILREIIDSDANDIFAIRGDYEVTKYNSGKAYTSTKQAGDLIKSMSAAYDSKSELRWGITISPGSTVVGMCGYDYWDHADNRASIGFDLQRSCWRNGYMYEALSAILNFGFISMALNRIEVDTSIYNDASANLLRRLGFQQEGHQRQQYYEDNEYHDLLLFGLLSQEWQAIRELNVVRVK